VSAFVDECRREWKRLGVPDLLAEEMATELEADLADAEADGVSAAQLLGESDPHRFAATWATERGLVPEPPPKKTRKRLWIGLAVVLLLLLLIVLPGLALVTLGSGSISTVKSPQPVRSVVIPNFVGRKACQARRIALESGLKVRKFPKSRCNAVVVAQQPLRGTLVQWPRGAHTTVILRLRAKG
jgi:hypothetical protein